MSANTEQRKLAAIIPLCGTDTVGRSAVGQEEAVRLAAPVPQQRIVYPRSAKSVVNRARSRAK